MAHLHVIGLPQNPVASGDYARFEMNWFLQDPLREIKIGDVVFIQDITTGAGDLEVKNTN
jgi:hypothetical protein